MNSLRASCPVVDSKQIALTDSFSIYSNLIYRLYKQCRARVFALALLKTLANLQCLVGIVDRFTGLFVILATLLEILVEQIIRQKVVYSSIYTAQIYNHALMMAICRQGMVVGLELEAGVLGRSSSEIVVTGRILKWLFLFHKSNWKVIDLVAQSIIGLC